MAPSTPEKKELGKLPQYYADMFGWEKMVAVVAAAYDTLDSRGEGAMRHSGQQLRRGRGDRFLRPEIRTCPKAISGHNNYWLWGPRGATGEVVIRLGGSLEAMNESYAEVIQAGMFHDDYCMPYENDMTVWVLKGRRTPLSADWAEFKSYE